MQRVLLALGIIVFVGAAVVSATGAFFNDTETSTGNTFTAGALDLTVDSEQHYNNAVCVPNPSETVGDYYWQLDEGEELDAPQYPVIGSPCDGTWLATNLGAHKFFNFDDVKPGDEGENTISLHVDSNDAYACVDITITQNDDVDCTDPENDAEGVGICNTDGAPLFDGELAANLNFFAWADFGAVPGFQGNDPLEGDNVWQANEPPLFSNVIGPASDALDGETYTLADSITGPLAGGSTSYIGLAWCAGTLTAPVPGTLLCDGASMGNDAQTDNLVADFAFRIEQARNNENFTCGREPEVVQTTLTLEKVITQDQNSPVTETAWTLTGDGVSVDISGSEGDPAVTNAIVPAGAYILSESVLAGFTQTDLQCVGGALVGTTVTVAEGANVTCTFFNTENTLLPE